MQLRVLHIVSRISCLKSNRKFNELSKDKIKFGTKKEIKYLPNTTQLKV